MSDGYGVDLDEVLRLIDRAAVLIVRFDLLEQRLLVDFRAPGAELPMITMVDRVNSAEERFRHLKSLRPKLPLPERIHSFPWPRAISAFEASGLWGAIAARLDSLGAPDAEIAAVRRQLLQSEAAATAAAIRGGDGFRTLWERQPA